MSPLSIILLSPVKVILSEYAQIKHCLKVKTVQNSSKQICWWILMCEDNRGWTFSPEEALLWIKDSYFGWKQRFEIKNVFCFWQTRSFSLHKTSIDVPESCGLFWCFYQMFRLSFWRHPFTAEDPLVSKWCNATFLQICSDEDTNSSASWMAWG